MSESYGNRMRQALASRQIMPFIGVYDAFSASVAAQHYDALFISGFGFVASHYGDCDAAHAPVSSSEPTGTCDERHRRVMVLEGRSERMGVA